MKLRPSTVTLGVTVEHIGSRRFYGDSHWKLNGGRGVWVSYFIVLFAQGVLKYNFKEVSMVNAYICVGVKSPRPLNKFVLKYQVKMRFLTDFQIFQLQNHGFWPIYCWNLAYNMDSENGFWKGTPWKNEKNRYFINQKITFIRFLYLLHSKMTPVTCPNCNHHFTPKMTKLNLKST